MAVPKLPAAPLEYGRRRWMQLWFGVSVLFLYAPLLMLIIYSFNDSKRNIVWRGATTKYYELALGNESLMIALGNSLTIAFAATLFSMVLGTLSAILLWRFRFPFRSVVEGTIALPMVVPEVCLGVAMLSFFTSADWPTDLIWPFNMSAIIVAHITFCFPFATMVIRAKLNSFNREQEEAARDLGAGEWQILRDILIPHMKPGIIAGALLSFTLSLDDFVITFFTSGPDTVTFPVKIYSMVRFSVTPEVNAATSLLMLITIIMALIAMKFQDFSKETI